MLRACLPALLCAAFVPGLVDAQDAGSLRSRHAALRQQLAASPLGRPVHVESTASGNAHRGEIYAVIERPFGEVAAALRRSEHWCEMLMLQVNIKRCEAGETISAFIARRPRDTVESAHRMEFRFDVPAASADYLQVALASRGGAMGTRDNEIRLQAAPLDARRTFMHMSYAYVLGSMARSAMETYLATTGRDKVGFSVVGQHADGKPLYVDGARGVIERNAMRYYFAIEAFIESPKEFEARLRKWYDAIERYPQLREQVGADEYVEMKRREAAS